MSKRKQTAASQGGYRARTGRVKRPMLIEGRVQAALADVGIYAATVSLARLAARRKVNP